MQPCSATVRRAALRSWGSPLGALPGPKKGTVFSVLAEEGGRMGAHCQVPVPDLFQRSSLGSCDALPYCRF